MIKDYKTLPYHYGKNQRLLRELSGKKNKNSDAICHGYITAKTSDSNKELNNTYYMN